MEYALYTMPLECEQAFEFMLSDSRFKEYVPLIRNCVYAITDPYGEINADNAVVWKELSADELRADRLLACDWETYLKLLPVVESVFAEMRERLKGRDASELVMICKTAYDAILDFNYLASQTSFTDTFAELTTLYYRMDPPDWWIRTPEEAIWEAGFSVDDIAVRGDRDLMAVRGSLEMISKCYKDPIKDKLAALDNVRACVKKLFAGIKALNLPESSLPLWMAFNLKIESQIMDALEQTRLELVDAYRKSILDIAVSKIPQVIMSFEPKRIDDIGDVVFDAYDYSRPEEAGVAVDDLRDIITNKMRGMSIVYAIDTGVPKPECCGLSSVGNFRDVMSSLAGTTVKSVREIADGGLRFELSPNGGKPFTLTAYTVIHSVQPGRELDQSVCQRVFLDAQGGKDMLQRKKEQSASLASKLLPKKGFLGRNKDAR